MLFEIQLLKSKDSELDSLDQFFSKSTLGTSTITGFDDFNEEQQSKPEFSREEVVKVERKPSEGGRSILLKGEMRYLKDVNMLVFLCSPL